MQAGTLFEDAVDIRHWLEQDRDTPYAQRVHRDRGIGSAIDARDSAQRVRHWWRAVDRDAGSIASPPERQRPGQRLAQGRSVVTAMLVVLGAVFGCGLAAAVLHYDGTQPVNVVRVVGVLVLPQIVLVLATLLLMAGRVPGLGALQSLLATLNPGAVAAVVYRRLAGDAVQLPGWQGARSAAARFARWQILTWSQAGAIAFNAGVLATAIALVAFTDLAFGWSTTLKVSAEETRTIVNVLAWPWHAWLPNAVPDQTLIETSRFYRLEPGRILGNPAALTGWWPFLLCALLVYGLLPRVLLFLVAAFRLRAATRRLLLDEPQVTALLDRMAAPEVVLDSDAAEPPPIERPEAAAPRSPGVAGNAHAVVWADSIDAGAVRVWVGTRLGIEVDRVWEAGGGRTLEEDHHTAEVLAPAQPAALVVLVRAWEPPMLDFLDFLQSARAHIPNASLIVVPVAADGAPVDAVHLATWQRAIARLGDRATYVETGA